MKPGPRRWAIGLCCSAVFVYLLTFVGLKGSPNDLQPVQGLDAQSSRADSNLEQLHPRGGWLSAAQTSEPLLQHEAPARKKLLAVVGVQVSQAVSSEGLDASPSINASPGRFLVNDMLVLISQTGFTTNREDSTYNYEARRKVLRATWFPASQSALDRFEASTKILLTFVLGRSEDAAAEEGVQIESEDHGGFMRLPVQEAYLSLTNKTLLFLKQTIATYEADFIVKVDDDVYLRLDRLPAAIGQWSKRGSDYIGCMKNGEIYTSAQYRWYEPQHQLLGGGHYFTHAWGPIYVLSWRIAREVTRLNPSSLRYFNNEDVTVGGWMLALNSRHDDERRLCEPSCTDTAIAVYDYPRCAGLCDPTKAMQAMWNSTACQLPALSGADQTLPELPPIFKFEHQAG